MAGLTLKPLFVSPTFTGTTTASSGDSTAAGLVVLGAGESQGQIQLGKSYGYRIAGGTDYNGINIYQNGTKVLVLDDTGISVIGAVKCTDTANSSFALRGALSGGSNLLILIHTNNEATTSSNSLDLLYDSVMIPDFTRHTNQLKIGAITTGSGQMQVQITDGTNTVTQNMTLQVNAVRKKDTVSIDCSTLADISTGKYWTITVSALATTGDYVIHKFNLQGNPVDFMSGQTLILANPATAVSLVTPSVMDTKYFPINYAIDNSCQARFLANIILGTGVTSAELKCRLTTTNGISTTYNECILTVGANGIVQGYIDFPSIVAAAVKVEIFGRVLAGTGIVTLGHYELWLEV